MGKGVLILLIILLVLGLGASIKFYRNNSSSVNENVNTGPLLAGNNVRVLTVDGLEREYGLFIPSSYESETATPLVIALHGGGGKWVSAQKGSQLDVTAEREGFIVVYPNSGEEGSWNVGPRVEEKRESDVDDVKFIKILIDSLSSDLNIDKNKIYVTGLSNGGMMTYRLACDLSDKIAAVAPVATTLMNHPCDPINPISIIHFQGTGDKVVPYNGGTSSEDSPDFVKVEDNMRSTNETIAFWRNKNGCSNEFSEIYREGDVICIKYECSENTEIVQCTINNGGHVWPGGEYEVDRQFYINIVGEITEDITASDYMWEFFKSHPKN